MRLVLTMWGVDIVDLQLRFPWPRPRQAPSLEASSGGQFEQAKTFGDPATISGFGFHGGSL